MTSSAPMRAMWAADGVQVAGQDLRLGAISGLLSPLGNPSTTNNLAIGSGVRDGTNGPLQVAVSSGLSVSVNTGFAAIQGSAAANAGAYMCTLDSAATLTCNAADPVNPRIDTVAVVVTDNGNNTSNAVVEIVTGTPAPSPSAPVLPANSLALCNVTVPANATTLNASNLLDQRTFMVGAGGIKPVANSSQYPAESPGASYIHDNSLGRLLWCPNGTIMAPRVAAFPDVWSGIISSTITNSTTYVTVCSINVTVDGHTSVNLTASWGWLGATAAVGNACNLAIFRGSGELNGIALVSQAANVALSGASWVYQDTTPAAGTYTYSLRISNQGAGTYTLHTASLLAQAAHP